MNSSISKIGVSKRCLGDKLSEYYSCVCVCACASAHTHVLASVCVPVCFHLYMRLYFEARDQRQLVFDIAIHFILLFLILQLNTAFVLSLCPLSTLPYAAFCSSNLQPQLLLILRLLYFYYLVFIILNLLYNTKAQILTQIVHSQFFEHVYLSPQEISQCYGLFIPPFL